MGVPTTLRTDVNMGAKYWANSSKQCHKAAFRHLEYVHPKGLDAWRALVPYEWIMRADNHEAMLIPHGVLESAVST